MFEALVASGPRPRSAPHRYAFSAGIHAACLLGALTLAERTSAAKPAAPESLLTRFTVAPAPSPPATEAGAIGAVSRHAAPEIPFVIEAPDIRGAFQDLGLPTVGDLLDRLGMGGDLPLSGSHPGAEPVGAVPAEAVDDPVVVIHQPMPRYPHALAAAGVSGRVELEYVVDTLGRVEAGSIRTLLNPDPSLTSAAWDAVLASRFRAARLHGTVVRQLVRQALVFRPRPGV